MRLVSSSLVWTAFVEKDLGARQAADGVQEHCIASFLAYRMWAKISWLPLAWGQSEEALSLLVWQSRPIILMIPSFSWPDRVTKKKKKMTLFNRSLRVTGGINIPQRKRV